MTAQGERFPSGLDVLFRPAFSNRLPRFMPTRFIFAEFHTIFHISLPLVYCRINMPLIQFWRGRLLGIIIDNGLHDTRCPGVSFYTPMIRLECLFSPHSSPFVTRNWRFQVKCVNKLHSFNLSHGQTKKWLLSDTDEFLTKRCLCLMKQAGTRCCPHWWTWTLS